MNAAATSQNRSELEAMNSGRAASGGARTVVLNGFAWGRDQMTQMFEFLNEGLADGHEFKLKFA
ncbi:MAG: hypothetical protein NVV83_10335 [Afipia sp.]|nr:hypothetical protein [Afipia sp.]